MAMNDFEKRVRESIFTYLASHSEIDVPVPQCPDVEESWRNVGEDYMPDGIREFNAYPTVSLGWIMFIGMAVAQLWDDDWARTAADPHIYNTLRDKRGFDHTDDYILDQVLGLDADGHASTSHLVNECACRVLSLLNHEGLAPGSAEAFRAYIACLHQLYLAGVAVQLHRMGYHMTKLG